MTENTINITMCKPVKCSICQLVLINKTVFMMHDKPFCSPQCKEKYFYNNKTTKVKNHLSRTKSHNKLPLDIESTSNVH